MRKNLCKSVSIALSLLMVCALFCFGVSAADATPVSTAAEFAAMAADGNYVLAADITIEATYETAFTGTLDGAGHTVTTSVPMFKEMNGTVKNLTVAGTITSDANTLGAVARATKAEKALFENITNKATITCTLGLDASAACVGGIVGKANNGSEATFKNCVNEGTLTGPEATGGILGESQSDKTKLEGCTNKGKIVSLGTKSGTAAGGIVGYTGTGPATITACVNYGEVNSANRAAGILGDARKGSTITNCINYGKVTGKNDTANGADAAGMVAYDGDKETTKPLIITNCLNAGEIYGQYRVGGLVGYVYGTKTNEKGEGSHVEVTNSVNIGKLSIGQFGSQFVAYTNSPDTVIKNCVGAGEMTTVAVEGKVNRLAIFGCSSVAIEKCTVENVYLVDGGKTEWLSWANFTGQDDNAKNRIPLATVLGKDLAGVTYKYPTYADNTYATVASEVEMTFTNTAETPVNVKAVTRADAVDQSLVDKANAAAGTTYVYLDGGKLTTVKPTGGSGSGSGDPQPPVPTGDYSVVVVAAIAVVSVIGVAYVSKKKHIAE